jgi:hypothetical protein
LTPGKRPVENYHFTAGHSAVCNGCTGCLVPIPPMMKNINGIFEYCQQKLTYIPNKTDHPHRQQVGEIDGYSGSALASEKELQNFKRKFNHFC